MRENSLQKIKNKMLQKKYKNRKEKIMKICSPLYASTFFQTFGTSTPRPYFLEWNC